MLASTESRKYHTIFWGTWQKNPEFKWFITFSISSFLLMVTQLFNLSLYFSSIFCCSVICCLKSQFVWGYNVGNQWRSLQSLVNKSIHRSTNSKFIFELEKIQHIQQNLAATEDRRVEDKALMTGFLKNRYHYYGNVWNVGTGTGLCL